MSNSLAVTTDELRGIIARDLNYPRTVTSLSTTQAEDVEAILKDGLRRFYDPAVTPKHQWSFLQPTIAWTWKDGQYLYNLPANFSMLDIPIAYAVDSNTVWPAVALTSVEKVLGLLQIATASGRPYLAAYRVKNTVGATDTSYELLCYPAPDQDYDASLRYKINPLALRADSQLPIGDQSHVQTLIEACLAAAEDFDSRPGVHNQRFAENLRASISHDQQVNSPRALGYNADRSDAALLGSQNWRTSLSSYVVTVNGAVPAQDGV